MMPYAFTVNGNRVPVDEEAFDEAVGYVNEQVFLLIKHAYESGFINAANRNPLQTEGQKMTVDFIAGREFEKWRDDRSPAITGSQYYCPPTEE